MKNMKMFHVLRITLLFSKERTSNKPFQENREMAPSRFQKQFTRSVKGNMKEKYKKKKINSQRNRY